MFEVKQCETLGRYVTASKLIKPGDIIMREMPLVIGPPSQTSLFCLGCNDKVDLSEEQYRCPDCRWPLCSPKCIGINQNLGHSKYECQTLAEREITALAEKSIGSNRLKTINEVIFHLRCLHLKHSQPEKWNKLLTMESHNDLRKNIPMHWYRNQFQIVNQIRESWGLDDFTEDEIHTVCGIIKVNCFGVGRQGIKGRGLYFETSLIQHDCSPNARVILDTSNYSMTVVASRNIDEGDPITITYVDVFMSTLQRRDELKNAKFFWCGCRRCADVTEFGTFCNALRCTECSQSTVLPLDPLDQKSVWTCTKCGHTTDAEIVASILSLLPEELQDIATYDLFAPEEFIDRYKKILSENHYLVLSAKYIICQSYSAKHLAMLGAPAHNLLKRKEMYCREILKYVEILVPGQTRIKGIVMFELYMTIMILSAKKLQSNEITKKEFRKIMQDALPFLEESEEILRFEPKGTVSRKRAEEAKAMLVQLKQETK